MYKEQWIAFILSFLSIFMVSNVSAREASLTRQDKVEIVEALDRTLIANYVFPDVAKKIGPLLRQKVLNGDYDAATTNAELAQKLTEDLVKISNDLHFYVGFDPQWIADYHAKDNPTRKIELRNAEMARLEKINFGFDEVRRLEGNIGYIRLNYFADPELSYETVAAAMRFVENSDAVIIDLRYNNGGYLEMAQFIASYFFSGDRDQLLFDYNYNQDGKRIARGQWVLNGLPGKRMVQKPVYILTGSTSFSSAEWFSYTLQKLNRATIIGERTAGGAHPVDRKPINNDFYLQVPIGQIRDPITYGDFEGVGVQPDIQTASIDALAVAHKFALQNLSKIDSSKMEDFVWCLPTLEARIILPKLNTKMLQSVVGKYEGREIILENGRLFYIWHDRFRLALVPIGSGLFDVEGVTDFRFEFIYKNNKVTELKRINKDGSSKVYHRET